MNPRSWLRVFFFGLLSSFAWLNTSSAAERVTVEQLHKYHASYHLHSVILAGRVRNMHALPPTRNARSRKGSCALVHGMSQFELVDETGTVPVETVGSCLPTAIDLPQNGDVIELTAMIHAFVPDGKTEPRINAVAQNIVIVKQSPSQP